MEMTLIEKTGQTRIKCSLKAYPMYDAIIDSYIAMHGGRKERETKRYVYYLIDADLLSKK